MSTRAIVTPFFDSIPSHDSTCWLQLQSLIEYGCCKGVQGPSSGVEFAPVCTPVRCPRCRNENACEWAFSHVKSNQVKSSTCGPPQTRARQPCRSCSARWRGRSRACASASCPPCSFTTTHQYTQTVTPRTHVFARTLSSHPAPHSSTICRKWRKRKSRKLRGAAGS